MVGNKPASNLVCRPTCSSNMRVIQTTCESPYAVPNPDYKDPDLTKSIHKTYRKLRKEVECREKCCKAACSKLSCCQSQPCNCQNPCNEPINPCHHESPNPDNSLPTWGRRFNFGVTYPRLSEIFCGRKRRPGLQRNTVDVVSSFITKCCMVNASIASDYQLPIPPCPQRPECRQSQASVQPQPNPYAGYIQLAKECCEIFRKQKCSDEIDSDCEDSDQEENAEHHPSPHPPPAVPICVPPPPLPSLSSRSCAVKKKETCHPCTDVIEKLAGSNLYTSAAGGTPHRNVSFEPCYPKRTPTVTFADQVYNRSPSAGCCGSAGNLATPNNYTGPGGTWLPGHPEPTSPYPRCIPVPGHLRKCTPYDEVHRPCVSGCSSFSQY